MTRSFRIALLLLAVACAASAQTPVWEELNGVAGFFSIAEGAGEQLYGIRGDGIIFTSSDRGSSWQPSTVLGGQIIALHARGNNAIVARIDQRATNSYQFHLSTDNGATWTRITTASNTTRQLLGLSDSGRAYATFRNVNFGNPNGPYYLLRFDALGGWLFSGNALPGTASAGSNSITAGLIDHTGVILLGTGQNGLFLTRDEGQTWEQSYAGRGITALALTQDNHIYLAANPLITDGGVYVSSDGARSWTYLGFSDKVVASLTADASGTLLASTSDGIYRYTGDPEAWEFSSPFTGSFDVMRSAGEDTILASSASWGLFRSVDGGSSWVQNGPRKRDVYSILVSAAGSTVAATLGGRVFRSTDEGESWTQALAGAICDNVYALAEQGGSLLAGTECGVYRSTDEGAAWEPFGAGIPSGPVVTFAVLPGGDIFAGTLFGVSRSTDGGASWNAAGLASDAIIALTAGPSGRLYAVTDGSGVFASDDGGASWFARGLVRNDLLSVHADEAGTLFVGAYGGVHRSTDGGGSWTEVHFTNGYVSSVASLGLQSVYAATQQGVFVSVDDGQHWNAVSNAGLFYPHILSLTFDPRGVLYAGTYGGGVYRSAQTLAGAESPASVPLAYALGQNYPNPFNPETVIEFDVPAPGRGEVTLRVFDLLGREVATLLTGAAAGGAHRVSWNAAGLPAGVYFYRLQAGAFSATKKMLLLR